MSTPFSNALNKAQAPNKSFQKTAKQGVANKMAGYVIKTNPTKTALGNSTCALCKEAKRTGAPLPPNHPNCRCKISKT